MDDHVDCHQTFIESLSHFNILQPISSSTVPCAQLLRKPCKTCLLTQRKTCSRQVNYQKLVQIWIISGSFAMKSAKSPLSQIHPYPLLYMPYILVTCQTSNRYPKSRGKIILGTFVRGNWEVHDTANISKNKYHLVIKYGWLENPWTWFLDGGFNGEIVQLAHQYPIKSHFSYPIESPENISIYKLHPLT